MPADAVCPRCGAKRPANALAGQCPQCLLRLGFDTEGAFDPRKDSTKAWPGVRARGGDETPRIDDTREKANSRISGILTALNESIGPVPRVLLRDSTIDEPRPVRPRSEEMPDQSSDPSRYQLFGEIARGGIGVILKGRDVDLGRDLAVKVLLEKHRDHPEMVRRFVEEAQIGGQLQHPGIVPVYELGQFPDQRLYIAMKLVKGRTLAALLEARKDPSDDRPRFLAIFEQICQTMAYAHSRGVVHRDLKPSNVMVGSFGEVQVMDWGLAKVLDQGGIADEQLARRSQDDSSAIRTLRTGSNADESRAGSVLGTPAYMAPEQARGELDTVDERADVFGLGSILCEILTGFPAYSGRSTADLYRKAERAELDDATLRLNESGADAELAAIAKECLSAAPKHRPRDAGVVLSGLSAYVASVEERLRFAGLAQAKAEARADEERKRGLLTVALAASVLVTTLLGAGGWIWVAREHAARSQRTAFAVNAALDESARLRIQARSAPFGETEKWVEAIDAVRRAEALLARGEGDTALSLRVQDALKNLLRDRDESHSAEKDRRMVERLAAIHDDLGVHLDHARADSEFSEAFRAYGVDLDALEPDQSAALLAARPVAVELAGILDQWTFIRWRLPEPKHSGAKRLIAIAKLADPDPWRNQLRDSLGRERSRESRSRASESNDLDKLAASADVEKLPGASLARLAWALSHENKDTAISLLRHAQRAHPDDFWINWDLGNQLAHSGQSDEAIRFFSVAVAIRPRSSFALVGLGSTLSENGRLEEAASTFRQAIQVGPDNAMARLSLATVLLDLGQLENATSQLHELKKLKPNDPWLSWQITNILKARGDWAAAIAELREGVELEPTKPHLHHELGVAQLTVGQIDDAIVSFDAAIRLDPQFVHAHGYLGWARRAKGELESALESFWRAHYLGSGESSRKSPWNAQARDTERLIALTDRLPAVLRGDDEPKDAQECASFARLCALKQLYADSARLWRDAFTTRPGMNDDGMVSNRCHAARAAALASCGRGRDDPPPDDSARSYWRKQALTWLSEELKASSKRAADSAHPKHDGLAARLGCWRIDPSLAGIRDEAVIAVLPDTERQVCRDFWSQVESLQRQLARSGPSRGNLEPMPPGAGSRYDFPIRYEYLPPR
jgi:eukaryotic-like serine/threonine-protein kinase